MGLFGSGKSRKTVKVTDIFTEEEIREIRQTIEPKLKSGSYKDVPQTFLKAFSEYTKNPDKEFSVLKLKTVAKVIDAAREREPSLAPILENGLKRIKKLQG